MFRAGLRTLLEAEAEIGVAGEATTGEEAVELAREIQQGLLTKDVEPAELLHVIDVVVPAAHSCRHHSLVRSSTSP